MRVKQPGSNTFVDLDAAAGIPLGSEVDTKKGEVEITAITKPGQPPAKAKFFDGIFKLTQSRDTIDLTLTEKLAPCKKSKKAKASATKPKTRKLWGDGKGKFRTKGTYSAATVRGTKWLTQDSLRGTLTRVTSGTVSVRDIVRKKTVLVRKGKKLPRQATTMTATPGPARGISTAPMLTRPALALALFASLLVPATAGAAKFRSPRRGRAPRPARS